MAPPTMRLTLFVLLSVLSCVSSAVPPNVPGGTTIPLFKRTSLTDANGVVNVPALLSQRTRTASKVQRGFQAYRANTGSFHPSDSKRTAKRQTGTVPLADDEEVLWSGTISVGNPPVKFQVDFDTGSSDTFLPGPQCSSNCAGHTIYNTLASSTAVDLGRPFSLAYGDGSTVKGEVFRDTVTIDDLTATSQAVGAATQYSAGFAPDSFPPDGLVGMAFRTISEFGENPLFETLIKQGKVTDAVFAFKLGTVNSELFLGGVNNALYKGAITYADVIEQAFWEVSIEAFKLDKPSLPTGLAGILAILTNLIFGTSQSITRPGASGIIDTGTTLIIGDPTGVAAIYDAIPGSKKAPAIGEGFYTYPCVAPTTISLVFNHRAFPISHQAFNLGQASLGSTECVGGIVAQPGLDFWVVGDVFLRNVYTIFDVGNTRVGFATLA